MMLNHILTGCRVSYKGEACIVTGAKCEPDGTKIKFRLLKQKGHREFWTGVKPCFDSIRQPLYRPYRKFVQEKKAAEAIETSIKKEDVSKFWDAWLDYLDNSPMPRGSEDAAYRAFRKGWEQSRTAKTKGG